LSAAAAASSAPAIAAPRKAGQDDELHCAAFITGFPSTFHFARATGPARSRCLHPARRRAEKYIADQPVPMRAHRQQVAPLPFHPFFFDDFRHRIAVGQFRLRVNSPPIETPPALFQVRAVSSAISGLTGVPP